MEWHADMLLYHDGCKSIGACAQKEEEKEEEKSIAGS